SAARPDRAAQGRARRREEPVRLRAVRARQGAPDDHLQLPHTGAGAVPLAMLRPVRSRVPDRLRRTDADPRLHGRLPQRDLMARLGHGGRIAVIWLVSSTVGMVLVAIFLTPHLPPGTGSTEAKGQRFDNEVLTLVSVPIIALIFVYFGYVLTVFRS